MKTYNFKGMILRLWGWGTASPHTPPLVRKGDPSLPSDSILWRGRKILPFSHHTVVAFGHSTPYVVQPTFATSPSPWEMVVQLLRLQEQLAATYWSSQLLGPTGVQIAGIWTDFQNILGCTILNPAVDTPPGVVLVGWVRQPVLKIFFLEKLTPGSVSLWRFALG